MWSHSFFVTFLCSGHMILFGGEIDPSTKVRPSVRAGFALLASEQAS